MRGSTKARAAWFAAGIAGLLLFVWLARRELHPHEPPSGEASMGASAAESASDATIATSSMSAQDAPARTSEEAAASPSSAAKDPMRDASYGPQPSSEEQPQVEKLKTSLAGSLLWDASVDYRDFRVTCRRAGVDDEQSMHLGPDGRFRRFAMDPGSVDVLVRMRGDEIPLRTIFDVVIASDGFARDARLEGIDVTTVKRFKLTFSDASGAPITDPLHALVLRPDGRKGRHVQCGSRKDGVLRVVVRDGGGLVAAWAEGFAHRLLELSGDQTIVVPRRALVTVRLRVDSQRTFVGAWLAPKGWEGSTSSHRPWWHRAEEDEDEAQEMDAAHIPVVTLVAEEHDVETGGSVRLFAVTKPGAYEAYAVPIGRNFDSGSETRIGAETVVVDDLAQDHEVEIFVSASDVPPERATK